MGGKEEEKNELSKVITSNLKRTFEREGRAQSETYCKSLTVTEGLCLFSDAMAQRCLSEEEKMAVIQTLHSLMQNSQLEWVENN